MLFCGLFRLHSHRIGANSPLQCFQPGLNLSVLGLQIPVLLFQRLDRDHQDVRHITGVNRRRRPDGSYAIISKGGEEILRHGAVMAELFGVIPLDIGML